MMPLKYAPLLLICCLIVYPPASHAQDLLLRHGHGLDLSYEQKQRLEERVKFGDADASWRLYLYYSFEKHDEGLGVPWLLKAARLRHPEAQRTVAIQIRDGWPMYIDFGDTPQSAAQTLLEDAARLSGAACRDLAKAFEDGYFGRPDAITARRYYQRGADFGDRMCWKDLARFVSKGIGGPRDLLSAYFWISLETRCTDPRSLDGKDSWSLRESIACQLSPTELETSWIQIDSFIADVRAFKRDVYPAAFLGTAIADSLRLEGQRLADGAENLHRMEMLNKK